MVFMRKPWISKKVAMTHKNTKSRKTSKLKQANNSDNIINMP